VTLDPRARSELEAKLVSLRKIEGLLANPDWREFYLLWTAEAAQYTEFMEGAANWEQFVAARAVRDFIRSNLLQMRESAQGAIEAVEAELHFVADETLDEDIT